MLKRNITCNITCLDRRETLSDRYFILYFMAAERSPKFSVQYLNNSLHLSVRTHTHTHTQTYTHSLYEVIILFFENIGVKKNKAVHIWDDKFPNKYKIYKIKKIQINKRKTQKFCCQFLGKTKKYKIQKGESNKSFRQENAQKYTYIVYIKDIRNNKGAKT